MTERRLKEIPRLAEEPWWTARRNENANTKRFQKMVREKFDIDEMFSEYGFSINELTHDLYFWGIKN